MRASPLDGKTVMSEAIHEVLHNGDPVVGWAGDKALTMTHSNVTGWELWRLSPEDGPGMYTQVARQRIPNTPLNLTSLVKSLAQRDTRSRGVSHEKVIDDYLAKAAKNQAAREKKAIEALYEPTAKVMDTVARASGARNKLFW